ncbi:hypothetical protein SAMN05421721_10810 [Ectothiorhodospira mobilis]|jgi:hypothetical protein|uniref:Uncharacterized protein n=1 Tax=Ectothiorhodospira mobilis TaxID=195064 RepID=A0A1I4RIK7_ECTMO|nr:hypothetical protein SAMN05421721_10810 [Ectothiorhodospira mobilis]
MAKVAHEPVQRALWLGARRLFDERERLRLDRLAGPVG